VSWVTWLGGGEITLGAGSVSRAWEFVTCSGAETGGGIIDTACDPGIRGDVMSLGIPLGLGGITAALIEGDARNLSRRTSGLGGTTASRTGAVSILSRCTSGLGATAISDRSGARKLDLNPSAGGGPGIGLYASRLATAALDCGNFRLGASTTFSCSRSPRATRITWVRWNASFPPACPARPALAPPRSSVCGNSSPEK